VLLLPSLPHSSDVNIAPGLKPKVRRLPSRNQNGVKDPEILPTCGRIGHKVINVLIALLC
jgi:hypothetical protein